MQRRRALRQRLLSRQPKELRHLRARIRTALIPVNFIQTRLVVMPSARSTLPLTLGDEEGRF